jgi:hypothetical protein
MAFSNAFAGNTFEVRKACRRSKIMAKANTEQAIKGQIGQPAACMMLNKMNLSTSGFSFDYV